MPTHLNIINHKVLTITMQVFSVSIETYVNIWDGNIELQKENL